MLGTGALHLSNNRLIQYNLDPHTINYEGQHFFLSTFSFHLRKDDAMFISEYIYFNQTILFLLVHIYLLNPSCQQHPRIRQSPHHLLCILDKAIFSARIPPPIFTNHKIYSQIFLQTRISIHFHTECDINPEV